jgi:hypothetical protein
MPVNSNHCAEQYSPCPLVYDKLWDTVNLRKDLQHYQEGFVMHPVPMFSEQLAREAVLNPVSHRDYRHPGSVFVPPKNWAERLMAEKWTKNKSTEGTFFCHQFFGPLVSPGECMMEDGAFVHSLGFLQQPPRGFALHLDWGPLGMLGLHDAQDGVPRVTPHAEGDLQTLRGSLGT